MKPLEEMGKFATVVVDPPWDISAPGYSQNVQRWGGEWAPLPYSRMSLKEIGKLPMGDLLKDDSLLFCWATNRTMPWVTSLFEAWTLAYTFTMVWVKPDGVQLPNTPRFNVEYAVVGRRGSPKFLDTKAFSAANYWPRRGHSEKPEGFYDLLRRVTPGPRLDVFGRRRIAGFQSWGNEAPDGPALPDHYQQVLVDA